MRKVQLMTIKKWSSVCHRSPDTAQRDIVDLVRCGLLFLKVHHRRSNKLLRCLCRTSKHPRERRPVVHRDRQLVSLGEIEDGLLRPAGKPFAADVVADNLDF